MQWIRQLVRSITLHPGVSWIVFFVYSGPRTTGQAQHQENRRLDDRLAAGGVNMHAAAADVDTSIAVRR